MAALYAVERRWRKPPPPPYSNEWETVWVNFNNRDAAVDCMLDERGDHPAWEYRVVEQGRVYGVAA
jgi:hypothetical protein